MKTSKKEKQSENKKASQNKCPHTIYMNVPASTVLFTAFWADRSKFNKQAIGAIN